MLGFQNPEKLCGGGKRRKEKVTGSREAQPARDYNSQRSRCAPRGSASAPPIPGQPRSAHRAVSGDPARAARARSASAELTKAGTASGGGGFAVWEFSWSQPKPGAVVAREEGVKRPCAQSGHKLFVPGGDIAAARSGAKAARRARRRGVRTPGCARRGGGERHTRTPRTRLSHHLTSPTRSAWHSPSPHQRAQLPPLPAASPRHRPSQRRRWGTGSGPEMSRATRQRLHSQIGACAEAPLGLPSLTCAEGRALRLFLALPLSL